MPKVLIIWLDNFKAKHNIKKYRQLKKTGVVDLVIVKKELQKIQKIVGQDNNINIYYSIVAI